MRSLRRKTSHQHQHHHCRHHGLWPLIPFDVPNITVRGFRNPSIVPHPSF
ncbi:unnamed protein product [Periconia digitata]|uniref:Uncharacterized protein n=1 Tax=Periconia digitata TaxID=1303443 RepID=A0A9W4XML8_9PLEO|nr:unnamed protein product [Periconia digitata]